MKGMEAPEGTGPSRGSGNGGRHNTGTGTTSTVT